MNEQLAHLHGLLLQRREAIQTLHLINTPESELQDYKDLMEKSAPGRLRLLTLRAAHLGEKLVKIHLRRLDRAVEFELDKIFLAY